MGGGVGGEFFLARGASRIVVGVAEWLISYCWVGQVMELVLSNMEMVVMPHTLVYKYVSTQVTAGASRCEQAYPKKNKFFLLLIVLVDYSR